MLSELRVFDNIPKYLLSPNAELKRRALDMLMRELERREVRRPWGSIEPFIVALYHVIFVDRDVEIGKLLLNYLDRVLPKVKNTLPIEVQEATDIILYAVKAEIGEIDKNSALKHIQNYRTTSPISELVKRVIIIELRGEYDELLDKLLKEISDKIRQRHWYLRTLLEEPAFRDIVEHFLLDLDMAQVIEEPRSMYTIHDYFVRRAKELQKEYEERRKINDSVKIEYEELKQRYNEIVEDLTSKIKRWLPITVDTMIAIAVSLLSMLSKSLIIASSGIAGLILMIAFTVIKRLRNIVDPYISNIASAIAKRIARYTREGRNIMEDMKYKERMLKDLESRLRKLR